MNYAMSPRAVPGILLLLLLLGVGACRQDPPQPPPSPLLEIGRRQLSLEQFERELHLNYPDISGLSEPRQLQLKAQLIKQLIDRELILGEAARLNVQISPDELDAELKNIRGSYSTEEFNRIISRTGKTYTAWIEALKLRLLTVKVSASVLAPQVEVTEPEAEQYYLSHKQEFHRPVEIRARQMLFPTREEAMKVLKLLRQGEDFAALARRYSHSPDNEKGGLLGYFSKGQLPAEFDDALFKLPVRQVSDPVASPYGFHLFLVERRRSAGIRPYAAIKDELMDKLLREKKEQAFHSWLQELQENTPVTVRWELLNRQDQQITN